MEIGIIAPIKLLKKYCLLTKVQYVVSSLHSWEPEYAKFYLSRKEKGDTIILDIRDPGWRRSPDKISNIQKCLEELDPDYVILPSFMFDIKATIKYLNINKTKYN